MQPNMTSQMDIPSWMTYFQSLNPNYNTQQLGNENVKNKIEDRFNTIYPGFDNPMFYMIPPGFNNFRNSSNFRIISECPYDKRNRHIDYVFKKGRNKNNYKTPKGYYNESDSESENDDDFDTLHRRHQQKKIRKSGCNHPGCRNYRKLDYDSEDSDNGFKQNYYRKSRISNRRYNISYYN